eukprot:CAMPEP_0171331336 /NCGR_PEP_ID=MMETSP0878-20121228/2617_1 /TAXON_ID=67004 /ORGANISM="Thalassiosira weissflogii, Strain CCMP1336" /LENGTH=419 /DNA_ID=CAMNT_0011831839 /DNA_START=489 /DNA_END=1748 /DNA_ORIENTATION=+
MKVLYKTTEAGTVNVVDWKEGQNRFVDCTSLKNNNATHSPTSVKDSIGTNQFMCQSNNQSIPDQHDTIRKSSSSHLERLSTDVSTDSNSNEADMRNKAFESYVSSIKSFIAVVFVSVAVMEFSQWFPFNIPGVASAAVKTYIPAGFRYDNEHSRFDNTAWTYNTDYLLTVVMIYLAYKCFKANSMDGCPIRNSASLRLRVYSASLLICYGASTLAGGWAHQHFTSIDSLNTLRFRLFWIVCVGNVSFASCYMGLIGREVQRVFGIKGAVPLGPWWFWPMYGTYMAIATALGYISFKRPACDIFIAGITQFPTTFYCLLALGLRSWPSTSTTGTSTHSSSKKSAIDLVSRCYRIMYYIGFIGNAPLLPMYPLLVQYSGMSLAGINTLLHSWLMVMWGFQGISLLHLCNAISNSEPKVATD